MYYSILCYRLNVSYHSDTNVQYLQLRIKSLQIVCKLKMMPGKRYFSIKCPYVYN